jgi:hypothetical protein
MDDAETHFGAAHYRLSALLCFDIHGEKMKKKRLGFLESVMPIEAVHPFAEEIFF